MHQKPEDKLPENFISEKDFFDMASKVGVEEIEDGELRTEGGGNDLVGGQNLEGEKGEVDERRLMEVLGKDLKGVVGLS